MEAASLPKDLEEITIREHNTRLWGDRFEKVSILEPERSFRGDVYLVVDRQTGLHCVLKKLAEQYIDDPVMVRQAKREALNTAKSRVGPSVLYLGEQEGSPFFVAELIDGMNFEDYLKTEPGKPEDELSIPLQILRDQIRLKNQGLWHRDIRGRNVIVYTADEFLPVISHLLDFGSSYDENSGEEQYPLHEDIPVEITEQDMVNRTLNGLCEERGLDNLVRDISRRLPCMSKSLEEFTRKISFSDNLPDDRYTTLEKAEKDLSRIVEEYRNRGKIIMSRRKLVSLGAGSIAALVSLTTIGYKFGLIESPPASRAWIVSRFTDESLLTRTRAYQEKVHAGEAAVEEFERLKKAFYEQVLHLKDDISQAEGERRFPSVVIDDSWLLIPGGNHRYAGDYVSALAQIAEETGDEKIAEDVFSLLPYIVGGRYNKSTTLVRFNAHIDALEIADSSKRFQELEEAILENAGLILSEQYYEEGGYLGVGWGVTRAHGIKRSSVDSLLYFKLLMAASEISGDERFAEAAERNADTVLRMNLRREGSVREYALFDSGTGEFVRNDDYEGRAISFGVGEVEDDLTYSDYYQFLFGKVMMESYLAWGRPEHLEAAALATGFGLKNLPDDNVSRAGIKLRETPLNTLGNAMGIFPSWYLSQEDVPLERVARTARSLGLPSTREEFREGHWRLLQGMISPENMVDYKIKKGIILNSFIRKDIAYRNTSCIEAIHLAAKSFSIPQH